MSASGGWYSVRYFKQDIDNGLFDDWRTLAWRNLYELADIQTGEVRLTVREMADMWGTSVGSAERWLTALAATGRNIRMERSGDTHRHGRTIVVLDVEERALSRAEKAWNKDGNKDGTIGGTIGGTKKASNAKAKRHSGGTKVGTDDGTKAEQSLGHVYRSTPYDEVLTVPSEQCAEGEADLFGHGAPPQPLVVEPPAQDESKAAAQRIVGLFHELSKAGGGRGVSQEDRPAQLRMAASAVRKGDMSESAACEAVRWGMGKEYQRRRLRAEGMKVLRYVWSEWIEETGGENGNGRSGAGAAAGNGGTPKAGAGAFPVLVNGRWERRTG
jgi:hypothetical protein